MGGPPIPTSLIDWIDDLTVRFLLNLPKAELSSVPRLCFQAEEAQWFYEDFARPAVAASGAPPLPSLPLRQFCLLLFQHCPLLSGFTDAQHIAAYEEFLAYKVRVPVRGAILLDQKMEQLVLVRGWKKGASWSFPRGKINKDEKDLDCAIREVYEETGYDLQQSGLISDKDGDVKHIDVTMREQHMRLFVFRGVPEETHFEPKTRKEIGKIQWYAIKDLPGFKRHKQGHPAAEDTAHANKFYMVAPFMGQLKKWINEQRRLDTARAQEVDVRQGFAEQVGTEDESGMVEEEYTTDHAGADERAEELKRLLSIGASAQALPEQTNQHSHAGNLLAMLQQSARPANGGQLPHTPFEQINAFAQQPMAPQPQHFRQPSLPQQLQPLPHFPFSPQRMHQEPQRNFSVPTPNVFGPPAFPPSQQPGFAGMPPPHLQHQQFQQRPSMPGPIPGMPFGPQNGMPTYPTQMRPPPQAQYQFQAPPPDAYMAQGPQGAIGGGPAVPNASQLPPPKLNAHSTRLLESFTSGSSKRAPSTNATAPDPAANARPTSAHQAALLSLLTKPLTPSANAAAVPSLPEGEPASPALTDVTVKASRLQERRPTLNEITRTLSVVKPKVKSPTVAQELTPIASQQPDANVPPADRLFDPSKPMTGTPYTTTSRQQKNRPDGQRATSILQPPSKSPTLQSPKAKQPTSRSPSRREPAANPSQNGHQPQPFTILARPGSAKAPASPPVASPSVLRNTDTPPHPGPVFHPQVLKRPKAGDSENGENQPNSSAEKREQLLALFGKQGSTKTESAMPPSSQTESFTNASDPQQRSPNPPPAPKIEPERHRSSASGSFLTDATKNPQQNLLLGLLTKSSASGDTKTQTPGTPISPFTLGTPMTVQPTLPSLAELPRSRIGSAASQGSANVTTPTEHKEFLMGYLNGVVKNEGHRTYRPTGQGR